MIRIRYGSISSGLHAKAESGATGTTLYLLPGLSSAQRKAALRRLRQEARRGCGPTLPLEQLAMALAADWINTRFRRVATVVKLHPAGSLIPVVLTGGCVVLLVLASESVRIVHRPMARSAGGVPVLGGGLRPFGGLSGPPARGGGGNLGGSAGASLGGGSAGGGGSDRGGGSGLSLGSGGPRAGTAPSRHRGRAPFRTAPSSLAVGAALGRGAAASAPPRLRRWPARRRPRRSSRARPDSQPAAPPARRVRGTLTRGARGAS